MKPAAHLIGIALLAGAPLLASAQTSICGAPSQAARPLDRSQETAFRRDMSELMERLTPMIKEVRESGKVSSQGSDARARYCSFVQRWSFMAAQNQDFFKAFPRSLALLSAYEYQIAALLDKSAFDASPEGVAAANRVLDARGAAARKEI